MNKIYIYEGAEFNEAQVAQAAKNLGLSIRDYIEKYSLKLKGDEPGKLLTTDLGAPVEKNQAPESLGLTLTDTTSVSQEIKPGKTPQTGIQNIGDGDTLALTEEDQESSKNIVSTLVGKTARGILNTASNIQSIPENLLYGGIAAFNPDMTAEEKIVMKNAISTGVSIATPLASKNLKDAAKAMDGVIKKYDDKDIYTAISNGNYVDALEMTVGGALESAPSIGAAMTGVGGIAVFGASIMSNKFDEELRADPEKSLGMLTLNSLLTGANEAAGELLTRKLLFATKLIKTTGAAGAAAEFLENGLKSIFKKYAIKPAGEGFSESLTEIANAAIDNITLGKDITWPQLRNQLVEAFTVGAFTGGAVNSIQDAHTDPMSKNLAEQILMPSQTQFELRNKMNDMSRFGSELQKSTEPMEQKAYMDMMAETEQEIIDLKNKNKFEINTLEGGDLKKYSKNRDQVYKLDDINKKETTPFVVRKRNSDLIKKLNKENNGIIQESVEKNYENNLTSIQEYSRNMNYDVKEFTSQESFDEFLDKKKGERAVRLSTEGIIFPSSNLIVINKNAAIASRNINAPAHEMLHAVMVKSMIDGESNAEAFAESIFEILKNKVSKDGQQDTEFTQRLQSYMSMNNYGRKKLNQEVMTLFNDGLVTGDIDLSESKLTELGDIMRRTFYSFGFQRKFDKPQDVLNFLKDYNNSIKKGYVDKSIVRIAKEGAQGRLLSKDDNVNQEVGEMMSINRKALIEENKQILASVKNDSSKLTSEQKLKISNNVSKIRNFDEATETKAPDGVSKKSIELSEKTQQVYKEKGTSFEALEEIIQINKPFIKSTVNRFFKENDGFKERAIDKETFEFYLKYGIDNKRTANSIYRLLKTYKPEMGKPLSQYIMQNLPNRAKGLLTQVVGKDVTIGASDIDTAFDIGEEMELPELPLRLQRRAISLGIKKDIYSSITSNVKNRLMSTLPVYYRRDFISRLQNDFRSDFASAIQKTWPKKEAAWEKYVNENIEAIYETFTQEKVRASTSGNLRDILYDKNKLKPLDEVKEQLIEYYVYPKSKTSTDIRKKTEYSANLRSQHKLQLSQQIADAIGFDAAADILETDPDVQEAFNFKQKMSIMQTGLVESAFDEKEIITNTLEFINDKIRNIDLNSLESAAKERLRKISRAALKLSQQSNFKDMDIVDINNFFIEEFGLDYVSSFNVLESNYNLLQYVKTSDSVDRNELKELYDVAEKSLDNLLKVVYKKGETENEPTKKDNFNTFEEFYRKEEGIEEDDELYSLSKKYIIETLNEFNVLPKDYKKMTRGQLEDYMNNKAFEEKKKQIKGKKVERSQQDLMFNELLEETEGIDKEQVLSRAESVAYTKWRRKKNVGSIIPASAEDFEGLLYKLLARGKKGEKQYKFLKENLIDTYNKGVFETDVFKNSILLKHQTLLKTLPQYKRSGLTSAASNVKKYLEGELDGTVVSRQNAVRLYLWRMNGSLTLPGDNGSDGKPLGKKASIRDVSVEQLDQIIKTVKADKDLMNYAHNIGSTTKRIGNDGRQTLYTDYNASWLGGNIGVDLLDYANGIKRSEFLSEWQGNVDNIFDEKNLNKLQALYGVKYVVALKDILRRMKSGRNRSPDMNTSGARFLDFINGAVGNIMFFNGKSAALQVISFVNYLNWSDNNIASAGVAFANQPQYWKDFMFILNSDFLKARRGGLKIDIAADELAQTANDKNKFWRLFSKLGKAGFIPTQIMDSAAISLGGASFYRNRVSKYSKEGLSKAEAEEQAMIDFIEITNKSQQSSDPSKISKIQADGVTGRLVFAFANTSMQYSRLLKKSTLDFFNGRGNQIENLSKIGYYGGVQAIIFGALANLALPWGDDEEEPKKKDNKRRALESIIDGHLRGIGMGGIAAYVILNMKREYIKQEESGRKKPMNYVIPFLSFSPPLQSKARNIVGSYRKFTYKQDLDKMEKLGYKLTPEQIMNPRWMAYALMGQSGTSIPFAKALGKLQNLYLVYSENYSAMDDLLLTIGFDRWTLDLVETGNKSGNRTSSRTSKRTEKR